VDFEKIYSDYYTYVYRFLLSLGRDESLAEELTAETFYRAYINLTRLRDPALCPTWLCSIAKNLYYTHIKHESKFDSLDEKLPCGTDVAISVEQKAPRSPWTRQGDKRTERSLHWQMAGACQHKLDR